MKLHSFNFKNVKLQGRLKEQFETVKREYLSIPNDDLLKGFRLRAGFNAPGNDLGGWYTRDLFHNFGQIISGLSRMASASNDHNCCDKVNLLLAEWAKCIASDGYFFYSDKCNAPNYVYDKMAGGLIDAFLYCDNKEALNYLSRITDWAIKNLHSENRYSWGCGDGGIEWYTLSENIYRAYLVTGEQKYKEFARKWEYTEFWDIFAKNGNIFDRWHDYHAYSHVNSLGGAGAAYNVYGEEKYIDILINAYDFLFNTQTYASGGFGPVERFKATYRELIDSLFIDDLHFETQCGSWAIFKLVKHLLTITGNSRFGDWAELMVYNGIGASLPMNPSGDIQYWSNYNLFGASKKKCNSWSCCNGTRPMAVADYYDLIWFNCKNNLFVNLYVPSSVCWKNADDLITVSQTGEIGIDDKIEFKISCPYPCKFKLNFRIPGWISNKMDAQINGQTINLISDANNWAFIERTWNSNDVLTLNLPIKLRVKTIDPDDQYPAAILCGPILLAGEIKGHKDASKIDPNDLCGKLNLSQKDKLKFTLDDSSIVMRPYYSFESDLEYFTYFDPQMAKNRQMKFMGWWFNVNNLRYANDPNSAAEYVFEGTEIRWNGLKKNDAGKAQIHIDGKFIDIIDQYHHNDGLPFRWTYTGLQPGKHVLHMKVLGEKHDNSKDCFVNITTFHSL